MENNLSLEDSTINIFIPMTIKRRGGSALVILPQNALDLNVSKNNNKPNYDHKIINALVKAYKWQQKIDKAGITLTKLAEFENISDRYVSRILRLNHLAPDIVRAIIEGKQPRTLKLQDLTSKSIPDLWQEQREAFGFKAIG